MTPTGSRTTTHPGPLDVVEWSIIAAQQFRIRDTGHDSDIAAAYWRNAESLGRTFGPFDPRATASTDMGNVSLAMPSIHPGIGIDSLPAVNHQPEFAAHCVTPAADHALRDGTLVPRYTSSSRTTSRSGSCGMMGSPETR